MVESLTELAEAAYRWAVSEANRFNHESVRHEHVLLALAREAGDELAKWGEDPRRVRLALEQQIFSSRGMLMQLPPYSMEAAALRSNACAVAAAAGRSEADVGDLLLATIDAPNPLVASVLEGLNLEIPKLREAVWSTDLYEVHAAVVTGAMPLDVFADWLEDRALGTSTGVRWLAERGKQPIDADGLLVWHHAFSPFVHDGASILPYRVRTSLSDRYVHHGLAVHAAAAAVEARWISS